MKQLKFWESWSKQYKILYWVFLSLFGIALVGLLYALITGSTNIIDYEILLQSEGVPVVLDTIDLFPFSLEVTADAIIFNEWFGGSDLVIKPFISYLYLFFIWNGFLLLITISTELKGYWYYIGTALLIVFMLSLRLEVFELFGELNRTPLIISLIFFLIPSYYFKSFNNSVNLKKRFLTFSAITLLLVVFFSVFSEIQLPFLNFSAYSMIAPVVITVIFIFMVAHEIPAIFLSATTSGNFGEGNWKHFLVVTLIYFINLLLILLSKVGALSVNLIPINVLIFFVISAILGVWGFRERESQYNYLFNFKPLGGYFYLGMGIVAFTSIAYYLVTANDQLVKTFENLVLYSHLGYGAMFFLYIISNFLGPLMDDEKVGRIMYSPKSMPYFTYRLAGLITTLAFIFYQEWKVPVYNAVSAYYNSIGDVFNYQGDKITALGYYKNGDLYSNYNNRSNYSMARIYEKDKEYDKTLEYYSKSNRIRPSVFSYLNQANVYFNGEKFFETMFILDEASTRFPDNGPIANNLGLMYGRTQVVDSSLFFLDKALNIQKSKEVAKGNILASLAKSDLDIRNPDSLANVFGLEQFTNKTNFLAFLTSRKTLTVEPLDIQDSVMNRITHAYIYNYLLNQIYSADTSSFEIGRKSIENSTNVFFTRRLRLAHALNLYYKEEITRGLDELKTVVLGDYFWAAYVYNLMGLLYLDNGDFTTATNYFKNSIENFGKEAKLNYAIALSFGKDKEKALQAWDTLAKQDNRFEDMAKNIISLLEIENPVDILDKEDVYKYQWMVLHRDRYSEELINSLKDNNLKGQALLTRAASELELDHPENVAFFLEKFSNLSINDPSLNAYYIQLQCDLFAVTGNVSSLANLLTEHTFSKNSLRARLYNALILLDNNQEQKAEDIFNTFALKNPFYEEFPILASSYFDSKKNYEKGYNFLYEALRQNKYSVRLNKAYIYFCGKWGSQMFGETQLEEFKKLVPEKEYEQVEREFYQLIYQWKTSDPFAPEEN